MSLIATSVGYTFTFDPQVTLAGNIQSLTAATVQLVMLYPDGVTRVTRSCQVSSDGKTCTYTTASGDFPVPGAYLLQIVVTNTSGVFASPERSYVVSPLL